ncbi:unnamed protein product [Caenorhabditis nigoni]
MSILDARLQQLQEEIDEIVEVMEAASLRPSGGKRSVLVGRTPAHYYQLAAAAAVKRYENELTCSMHTMSILDARLQQLQEEIDEIVEVMEACHTIRAVNSL